MLSKLILFVKTLDKLIIQRDGIFSELKIQQNIEENMVKIILNIMKGEHSFELTLICGECEYCKSPSLTSLNVRTTDDTELKNAPQAILEPLFSFMGIPFCNREIFLKVLEGKVFPKNMAHLRREGGLLDIISSSAVDFGLVPPSDDLSILQ